MEDASSVNNRNSSIAENGAGLSDRTVNVKACSKDILCDDTADGCSATAGRTRESAHQMPKAGSLSPPLHAMQA